MWGKNFHLTSASQFLESRTRSGKESVPDGITAHDSIPRFLVCLEFLPEFSAKFLRFAEKQPVFLPRCLVQFPAKITSTVIIDVLETRTKRIPRFFSSSRSSSLALRPAIGEQFAVLKWKIRFCSSCTNNNLTRNRHLFLKVASFKNCPVQSDGNHFPDGGNGF